jgi:FeS assembly protein IscX
MKLSWETPREVGEELYEAHEDLDPLTLSFTKLRDLCMELDGFTGERDGCSEKTLEAIQMVWYEEWKLDHE